MNNFVQTAADLMLKKSTDWAHARTPNEIMKSETIWCLVLQNFILFGKKGLRHSEQRREEKV